jgi:TolB protein
MRNIKVLLVLVMVFYAQFLIIGCHKEPIAQYNHGDPAWSPDGKYIAFVWWKKVDIIWDPWDTTLSSLKILNLVTEDCQHLSSRSVSPSWSTDGKKLVCESGKIVIIDLNTKESKTLTDGLEPDWSPDGIHILFVKSLGLDSIAIFMTDTNGSNTKMLFNLASEPDWLPSGDKFVFFLHKKDSAGIYIGDTTGKIIRLIIPKDDTLLPLCPKSSPDGQLITYWVPRDWEDRYRNCFIYIIDTLGAKNLKVTEGRDPAWSPDGSQIVFARYRDEDEALALWIMNRDGSGQKMITNPE